VSDLRTEEEQVEVIKRWWKDNGNSLLIGIGLALAAIFGWKAWQQNVIDQQEQASQMFFELNQAATAAQTASDEDAQQRSKDIVYLAKNLQEAFPSAAYADFARLFQARQFAIEGEFGEAEKTLLAIDLKSQDNQALASVVISRLARVKAAQGNFDEALSLLSTPADDSFYVLFQELKGDLLKMKGDRASAKAAYEEALSKAEQLAQPTQLLQLKIDDLADV
jgi:predicted negative regulator of RcsB-dependent stress response